VGLAARDGMGQSDADRRAPGMHRNRVTRSSTLGRALHEAGATKRDDQERRTVFFAPLSRPAREGSRRTKKRPGAGVGRGRARREDKSAMTRAGQKRPAGPGRRQPSDGADGCDATRQPCADAGLGTRSSPRSAPHAHNPIARAPPSLTALLDLLHRSPLPSVQPIRPHTTTAWRSSSVRPIAVRITLVR
jgi:hypothetical protein